MRTSLLIVCMVGALLGALCASPNDASALEEKLTITTLPNGLKVLVREDHAKKVATIQLWVLVGSADEEKPEGGISHLIEHMAFKGTERRGVGRIAAEIEALGGETNAYTSWDETVFHVTVPSHAVNQGMDILTDAVLFPSIDPGELSKEIQVVIEEILEGEERPERKSSKLLFQTAYVKSPYQFPVIGYKEIVETFDRQKILDFRKKWYVPENMFLLVVGDVNPQKVIAEAEKLTKDFKPAKLTRDPRAVEPAQDKIRTSVLKDRNLRETRLLMAFHVPAASHEDTNALDLLGDILGSRDNSRLVRSLKKEKALVNSIFAYALTPKEPGIMLVSANLDAKNLNAAVENIMIELKRIMKEPPTADELEQAKIHIESQHLYARETVQGTARSIGSFLADVGDPLFEAKYLKRNAAVTAEMISAAARKYLASPNVTMSILVPEAGADFAQPEQLERIILAGDPPEKVGDQPTAPKMKDAETDATPKATGKTNAAVEGKELLFTLPNGIRVVMMPDDSNPVVSVRMAFLGGKRYETKENEGVMNFIAQMLDKGTSSMSDLDISNRTTQLGGRLSGFSGYDSFGLSGAFFSRNLESGLKLMAEVYKDVAFPQEQLDRERQLILNRIRTEPDRPVSYAMNVLNATVYPSHPYGFVKEGTLVTVAGFTAADLKQVYERFAVASNMVVTIVGAFDPEKTRKMVTDVLGAFPAGKLDVPAPPVEQPIDGVREKTVKIPRAKAHLALGFHGSTLKDEDKFPLEVLSNILAGQGGRLFQELRDKQSLAYTVTADVRPRLDPGIFLFYIACDESKADRALPGLLSEVEKIRNAPVDKEELDRSVNNLIGNHVINLQSSWARAENTGLNTLYGLGPLYDEVYLKKIAAVTVEDVQRVARKYLDPKKVGIVKILPEEENEKKEKK